MEAFTVHDAPAESSLHEPSTIRLRGLIKFVIWLAVAALVIHLIIWWLFVAFRSGEARGEQAVTGVQREQIPPPEPRLQPSVQHNSLPVQDVILLQQRERAEFARRGWIDPDTKSVRVPDEIATQIAKMAQQSPATQPAKE